MHTPEMRIDPSLMKTLHLLDGQWEECAVENFYEGNYSSIHFSAAILKARERLLIISGERYRSEVAALYAAAMEAGGTADVLIAEDMPFRVGEFLDKNPTTLLDYDAVIGATEYSLITTEAVKQATAQHKRFLSLPLSTNDGVSLLSHEFLAMDPEESRQMAEKLLTILDRSEGIEVTTPLWYTPSLPEVRKTRWFFQRLLSMQSMSQLCQYGDLYPHRGDANRGHVGS